MIMKTQEVCGKLNYQQVTGKEGTDKKRKKRKNLQKKLTAV